MNPSFEQTLVEVWRQVLVENADVVELGTERFPVRLTPKRHLRMRQPSPEEGAGRTHGSHRGLHEMAGAKRRKPSGHDPKGNGELAGYMWASRGAMHLSPSTGTPGLSLRVSLQLEWLNHIVPELLKNRGIRTVQ
jgi:hypothetical protein